MKWFIFLLVISSTVLAQQKIEGTVVDSETGKPVPFASLVIVGTSTGTSSNLNGQFSLAVADTFSIKITCIGYQSLLIRSLPENSVIKLKPVAVQLAAVVVTNKAINATKIVRKAFASISDNYDDQSFLQKFFYRHYNTFNSTYERLTEASVDVWKENGYRTTRKSVNENAGVRVTHLRRSLDIKGMVQEQRPLWIENILQSDIVGYQTPSRSAHLSFAEDANNLKTDMPNYTFTFDGITTYDGQEVYKINYRHKKDSVPTTKGYKILPQSSGSLFITTDRYAFVKTEDEKFDKTNTVRSTAYYRKYGNKYYPYHLVREGESLLAGNHTNSFHIELMSVEIIHGENNRLTGREPGRDELLDIPYDSSFWNTSSILKTTPLEDKIIYDLGSGISLNQQFDLYRQYELNVTDGSKNAEEKFNWLKDNSKGKRILFVCFWDSRIKSYLLEVEYMKQLNLQYKKHVLFVMISLENDEAIWETMLTKYNLYSDGIVNYRIGSDSHLREEFKIKGAPAYVIISKQGEITLDARRPNDPALKEELRLLMVQGQ
ncbi:MAG TPA: carboxypeptidase-like regulatory domain-containing protein [Cyclobacteriaceae bacterium]|nr:carboxypeptidase-like regulatory domain-containing protein [Cyclobacteriaceae bacterium]